MNTSKLAGIVLIIISLGLGYIGVNKIADSTKEINFIGIKFDASNESGQLMGFIYTGLAIVLFAGGLYALKKKDN